jgi:hypothetical protein
MDDIGKHHETTVSLGLLGETTFVGGAGVAAGST